jgi:hypothetical protein
MTARDESDASGDPPGALAFVHDRGALARRFLLAELLAPPLALRLRAGRSRRPAQVQSPEAVKAEVPTGGGRR